MTIDEYKRAYTQCEIRYLNDKSDTEAVTKQSELIRASREQALFKLHIEFTQLEYETMYLLNNEESKLLLKRVFNYYEPRAKHLAIIPKSIYSNKYIENTKTKRTPLELRQQTPNTSLRGYEMPLRDLANILNLKLD